MGKTFYTERDIEDMSSSGKRSLSVGDDVVLTDLAYEAAHRLGVKLVQPHENPPGAPVRPYINKESSPSVSEKPKMISSSSSSSIRERVKKAVISKLSGSIEEKVLERIIDNVFKQLGVS